MAILGFLGVVAVIILLIWFNVAANKKRQKAFKEAAEKKGLVFTAYPAGDIIGPFRSIKVFTLGRRRIVRNLIRGKINNSELMIFDYIYQIPDDEGYRNISQTAAAYLTDRVRLPQFSLLQRGFWHKFSKLFGAKEVEIIDNPEFNKHYIIKGEESVRVHKLFSADVISIIMKSPIILNIDARENKIVIYTSHRRLKPQELDPFIDTVFQLVNSIISLAF